MAFKNKTLVIAVILAIIFAVKGFNTRRSSKDDLAEMNKEQRNFYNFQSIVIEKRISQAVEKMSEDEKKQWGEDYNQFMKSMQNLGEAIGRKIQDGGSDQQIWELFAKLRKEIKRKSFYLGTVKVIGQDNMTEFFRIVKQHYKDLLSEIRAYQNSGINIFQK